MYNLSSHLFLKPAVLKRKIFILCIFLCGCSKFLTHIDEGKIEGFLSQLLLEEGGIYTLFGHKPMTDICFFTGKTEDTCLDGLSEVSQNRITYIDNTSHIENWKAWKEFIRSISFNRFCFIEVACPTDPLHVLYFIVNLEEVRNVIYEHQEEFNSRLGLNLKNFENQIRDPKSFFWGHVFDDHYLMGLLYGYGQENSTYFTTLLNEKKPPQEFSELQGPFDLNNFPLPVYASLPDESTKYSYERQREKIKAIYKNQDFVTLSLNRLRK